MFNCCSDKGMQSPSLSVKRSRGQVTDDAHHSLSVYHSDKVLTKRSRGQSDPSVHRPVKSARVALGATAADNLPDPSPRTRFKPQVWARPLRT